MMEELICKRAIRRLNKQVPVSCLYGADDFPTRFNTFDVLSIQIQRLNMDEINPMIEDYIRDVLDDEAAKEGCDSSQLYNKFRTMLDDHYNIKKIQNWIEKY